MAFITIPDSLIEVGKAITNTLFKTYVKGGLDDHESRINTLESGGSTDKEVFNDLVFVGATDTYTGVDFFTAYAPMSVDNAFIRIFAKGALTGILEIDVLKSTTDTNPVSFTTIFSTKPSIDFSTATDYEKSLNGVLNNGASTLDEGDILRFDITSIPSGLDSFLILVSGA